MNLLAFFVRLARNYLPLVLIHQNKDQIRTIFTYPGTTKKLGSVPGPLIQANGRLIFEDDLKSGGLLCFISMNFSVRTELADSMVTPGEPGGD